MDVDIARPVPEAAEEVIYRAAREAARNVIRHASARSAAIRLTTNTGQAILEVEDDGTGIPADSAPLGPRDGHFGLALLRDLLVESGGGLCALR